LLVIQHSSLASRETCRGWTGSVVTPDGYRAVGAVDHAAYEAHHAGTCASADPDTLAPLEMNMIDASDQDEQVRPRGSDTAKPYEDTSNVRPVSGSSERDFGDSAGYGGGGSAQDYRDVVGDDPGSTDRPNPLDKVMTIQADEAEAASPAPEK
jgi:hypothetical protein